jgi:transcriptional regulator with XRE-family HTH domain
MKVIALPPASIREQRRKAGLTQAELVEEVKKTAAAAGLPEPSITDTRLSEWENGVFTPHRVTCHLLQQTFARLLQAA